MIFSEWCEGKTRNDKNKKKANNVERLDDEKSRMSQKEGDFDVRESKEEQEKSKSLLWLRFMSLEY